jgi:hypothetical protein
MKEQLFLKKDDQPKKGGSSFGSRRGGVKRTQVRDPLLDDEPDDEPPFF